MRRCGCLPWTTTRRHASMTRHTFRRPPPMCCTTRPTRATVWCRTWRTRVTLSWTLTPSSPRPRRYQPSRRPPGPSRSRPRRSAEPPRQRARRRSRRDPSRGPAGQPPPLSGALRLRRLKRPGSGMATAAPPRNSARSKNNTSSRWSSRSIALRGSRSVPSLSFGSSPRLSLSENRPDALHWRRAGAPPFASFFHISLFTQHRCASVTTAVVKVPTF
mmetsp:Transcript_16065/g.41642  ORF Transcript_16065/g.41642 Transcript_16065/m.41642 type:complete len:217 (+) Transcript_16065:332-982(+)